MVKVEGITILPTNDFFFPLAMRCIGEYHKEVDDLAPPSDLNELANYFFESFIFNDLKHQPMAVELLHTILSSKGNDKCNQYDKEIAIMSKLDKDSASRKHKETYKKYLVEIMYSEIPNYLGFLCNDEKKT